VPLKSAGKLDQKRNANEREKNKMGKIRKGVVITPADLNGFDWLAEMRRLGLDTLGMHSGNGIGDRLKEKLGRSYSPEFRAEAADRGIQVEYELHSGSSLLPRELFDVRPECFRFDRRINGRTPDYNWCPSSFEARKIVGQNAVEMVKLLKPDTHRHFFWGDDNRGWCHCESCRRMDAADQELLAANVIARAIREIDSKAQVAFLAYGQSFRRPAFAVPDQNVFLEYAPMQRCYRHPINDPDCSDNRECWKTLLSLLETFSPDKTHVLEYWLDSSMYSAGKKPAAKPVFIKNVVREDIVAYHSLGIRSFTTFAVYMDGQYFADNWTKDLEDYAELLNKLE
jgi:hypothetical protein